MNILIRLPNWLGDLVMSSAFVRAVKEEYPGAVIDLVAKKGIDSLLDSFPPHGDRYIFSKEEFKGPAGAWKFGKQIAKKKGYDLFFCLPDSFSSALMGYASGAKKRIGYRNEMRSWLLTNALPKKKDLHRVEEYMAILQRFTGKTMSEPALNLAAKVSKNRHSVIININSAASSRRLPEEKAVRIIDSVRERISNEIILVGSKKEKEFVDSVFSKLKNRQNLLNKAGDTGLEELMDLLANAALILTTDSGPAHLANAMGTFTIVLFGAGNENETAPYNKSNRKVIRLGRLPCEPCVSNTCQKYGVPECLLQLDEDLVANEVQDALNRLTSA